MNLVRLVIPGIRAGLRGAGQWKDLQGIRQILNRLGVEWREFAFSGSNTAELITAIGDAEDVIIWYYSFWPEALEALKRHCPNARIVLRTVNAEALQHWTRAEKDWRRLRGLPRDLYGFARLLWRDRRCALAADALAGISPWDDAHYWRRLAPRRKVRHVPYLCPWPALLPNVTPCPWRERQDTVVCLAGSRDAVGRAHVNGFAALARRLELSAWRFASSDGFMDASGDELPARVERMGRIEEPWTLLCKVKAVAVLTPLGYGCKTTITDALAAGCHVLVHPRQHARLPRAEQDATIPIDAFTASDIRTLEARLSALPTHDAERMQRDRRAYCVSAWQDVLGV